MSVYLYLMPEIFTINKYVLILSTTSSSLISFINTFSRAPWLYSQFKQIKLCGNQKNYLTINHILYLGEKTTSRSKVNFSISYARLSSFFSKSLSPTFHLSETSFSFMFRIKENISVPSSLKDWETDYFSMWTRENSHCSLHCPSYGWRRNSIM